MKKVYSTQSKKINIAFEDLNPKMQRVINYIQKRRGRRLQNELSMAPILIIAGLEFTGNNKIIGGAFALVGSAYLMLSRERQVKEIKRGHLTLANIIAKRGILKKDKSQLKGHYAIDLGNIQNLVQSHPYFYVDKEKNLVFLKPTELEKLRIKFQRRFKRSLFSFWRGKTPKTTKIKPKRLTKTKIK